MATPNLKLLRTRWTAARVKRMMALCKAKGGPDRTALRELLGYVEGTELVDCRGFKPAGMLLDQRFEGIDFTGSEFGVGFRMGGGSAADCRFCHVKFRDMLCADFTACDFHDADLRGCTTTTGWKFESCDFTHADFGRAELLSIRFTDCRFVGASFKKAELSACVFTRCHFHEVDFTGAFIGSCRFVDPLQNMRWTDTDKRQEFVYHAAPNADWLVLDGAEHVLSLSVKGSQGGPR